MERNQVCFSSLDSSNGFKSFPRVSPRRIRCVTRSKPSSDSFAGSSSPFCSLQSLGGRSCGVGPEARIDFTGKSKMKMSPRKKETHGFWIIGKNIFQPITSLRGKPRWRPISTFSFTTLEPVGCSLHLPAYTLFPSAMGWLRI